MDQLEQARHSAPTAKVQNRHNFTDRSPADVLEYCEPRGIGFATSRVPGIGTVTSDRVSNQGSAICEGKTKNLSASLSPGPPGLTRGHQDPQGEPTSRTTLPKRPCARPRGCQ